MNSNINTQAKPVKKLTLNKKTIRQLTTTETTNQKRGVTLNCSLTC